jgi:hypothetical protein
VKVRQSEQRVGFVISGDFLTVMFALSVSHPSNTFLSLPMSPST